MGFIFLYIALLAAMWVFLPDGMAFGEVPWASAIPAYAALCVLSFQGAVSTHNSVHCPVFTKRWMNKIWQMVLTLSYGHPVSSYVPGHNLSHHKHTQSRKDVMRTHRARFRWNLLNLFFFMLLIVPSIMRADTAYTKSMRKRHPRWFRQMLYELVTL